MLQRTDRATRGPLPTPIGAALLVAATIVTLPVAKWGDSALVLVLAPAALAAYLAGRRLPALAPAVISLLAALALMLPVSYLTPDGATLGDWMAAVLIALLVVVLPWWAGRYRLLRARQRESDAAVLADRAQAEERARIADDLHDTIGHELALISVQAGALELGRGLTSEQRRQFQSLREAAVRASERLGEVVQLSSPGGASRLDPLGGGGIDALIGGAHAAGMPVAARIDRGALADAHPLIAELAVRVVREGLTNAARHAPGADVEIEVAGQQPDGLFVSVRSGTENGEVSPVGGSGHGIPSLRRRAQLLGAVVTADAQDDGFTLTLRTPSRPVAVAAAASDGTADRELKSNARNTRRGLLQTAMVPAAIIALAIAGFLGVQAVTVTQTAIASDVYARIEVGMTRAALAPMLPGGMPRPAPIVDEPGVPAGAECEYFAARDGWLHFTDATYRLCFRDGVLAQKLLLEAP